MDFSDDDLSIKTLIQAVSKELLDSQAERIASGGSAVFEVHDLTLEISFVVTNSKKVGGGFDLKVIKADAGGQYDQQSIQKITLKLDAISQAAAIVQEPSFGGGTRVAGTPVRPRKRIADEQDTSAKAE